jgi:hypothetical protein
MSENYRNNQLSTIGTTESTIKLLTWYGNQKYDMRLWTSIQSPVAVQVCPTARMLLV